MRTGELSTVKLSRAIRPFGIASTPSGVLLVTCQNTHSLYAVWPATGQCERIAGTGQKGGVKDGAALSAVFHWPWSVAIDASESCAYVSEYGNHCIRRVALSAQWFVPHASLSAQSQGAVNESQSALKRVTEPETQIQDLTSKLSAAQSEQHSAQKQLTASQGTGLLSPHRASTLKPSPLPRSPAPPPPLPSPRPSCFFVTRR